MVKATRPSLVHRTISDVTPLVEPSTKLGAREDSKTRSSGSRPAATISAQGTASAGMPRGGRTPASPFLPLGPVDIGALKHQVYQHSQHSLAEQAHSDLSEDPCHDVVLDLPRAVPMVRSFSLPVWTQKEFDARCRLARETEQPNTPLSYARRSSAVEFGRAGGASADVALATQNERPSPNRPFCSSQTPMNAAAALINKRRLASETAASTALAPRQRHKAMAHRQPRCPLSLVQACQPLDSDGREHNDVDEGDDSDELAEAIASEAWTHSGLHQQQQPRSSPRLGHVNFRSLGNGTGGVFADVSSSGSDDELDNVATPRAMSPTLAPFKSRGVKDDIGGREDCYINSGGRSSSGVTLRQPSRGGDKLDGDDTFASLADLIHPDHLAPPPPLLQ